MHTMDKETAITEARQRFKAWRCLPDSCSVPPLNPQRTNFDFEPIVSPHRFAIPFSGGHCIQLYKKLARCLIESATPVIGDCPDNQSEGMLHLWGKYIRTCRKRNARSSRSRSATARASGRWPVCWDAARPASAGRSGATRRFPSNESESYRPYRPKRLKTGPWTGRYYIAGPAQRKADRRRAKPRKPYRLSFGRLWTNGRVEAGRRCRSAASSAVTCPNARSSNPVWQEGSRRSSTRPTTVPCACSATARPPGHSPTSC